MAEEEVRQMELQVEMPCESCRNIVSTKLLERKIGLVSIDVALQTVVVSSSLPASRIIEIIEETGQRAVLKGQSGVKATGAAVGMISSQTNPDIKGVIRLTQTTQSKCAFDGTIDGLSKNSDYSLSVHELGDLSSGCDSCGDILKNDFSPISIPLPCDTNGRSQFVISTPLQLSDVIGRSLVLHDNTNSRRLACGIIARSAGLFQNPKTLCSCDGVTLWDERNVPLAGTGRNLNITDP